MKEKPVLICLHKKQIMIDIQVECSVIGRTLQRSPDTEEQGGDIISVDDELTKPIVARALTEAFGEVKRVCQRYLIMGRDVDDNRLERIDETNTLTETVSNGKGSYDLLPGTPYVIGVEADQPVTLISATGRVIGKVNGNGKVNFTPWTAGCITLETTAQEVKLTYGFGKYGTFELELTMPGNFNLAMTETMKSCAHRMIVDYAMHAILLNQWPEKSAVYRERVNVDADGLRYALQARTRFCRHANDWS